MPELPQFPPQQGGDTPSSWDPSRPSCYPFSPHTTVFQFPLSKCSEIPCVPGSVTSSPYSGLVPAGLLSPSTGPKSSRRPLSHIVPIGLHLQPQVGIPRHPRAFAHSHTNPSKKSSQHRWLSSPGFPPGPEATLKNPPAGPLTPTPTSSWFWAPPPLLSAGRARALPPPGPPSVSRRPGAPGPSSDCPSLPL